MKTMKIEITMRELPNYGDLFTLEKFIEDCEKGYFIDYDGHGYYATDNMISDIKVKPSFIKKGQVLRQFSHIMWFNR